MTGGAAPPDPVEDGDVTLLLDEIAGLRRALEHRDTIGQAKGILIATEGFTPDEAFAVLVAASQRESRKLYELAREMVERHVKRGEVGRPADRPD